MSSVSNNIEKEKSIIGFPKLERALGNCAFDGGNIIVLSGEADSGKTSFAMNIAYNFAKRGTAVEYIAEYFNISWSFRERLKKKYIEDVEVNKIKSSNRTVSYVRNKVKNLPLYIIDFSETQAHIDLYPYDVGDFCAEIRSMNKNNPLGLVVIENQPLLTLTKDQLEHYNIYNDHDNIYNVHILKELALELDITIIYVASCSRRPRYRSSRCPILSDFYGLDLGNSRDVDTVLFLYPDCPAADAERKPYYHYLWEYTTLIIAKNKYGEPQKISFKYDVSNHQYIEDVKRISNNKAASDTFIKEHIISIIIDSFDMCEYLQKKHDNISITDYVSIIARSPRGLYSKLDLLSLLATTSMQPDEYQYIEECKKIIYYAVAMLHATEGKKSTVNISLIRRFYDEKRKSDIKREVRSIKGLIYEDMERFTFKWWWNICGNEHKEKSHYQSWYFKIDLYDRNENNKLKHVYEFISPSEGSDIFIEYFKDMRNLPKPNTKQPLLPYNIFSGENIWEDMWVTPYQPGDLLYIDCGPYKGPVFSLIYYVSKSASVDSESLMCTYPTFGGLIEQRTIDDERVFVMEREYFRDSYISPFYRAEIYRSELPESCKFMEPVIKALKKKPELGEYIDIFVGYGKEYQIDPKEDVKMFGISEKQWNIIVDFCNKNVDNDSDVTI